MDVTNLFKQKKEREVDWHTIPGSNARLQLMHLLPEDLDKIAARRDVNQKGRLHYKKYREAVMKEAIKGWEGIEMDGQPLPCSDENKLALDGCWGQFRGTWVQHSGFVAQGEDEEADEELPNS